MSQNWLITGAGHGFGRAFVSAAAESGAEVYAGVRHVPEGDPLFHTARACTRSFLTSQSPER